MPITSALSILLLVGGLMLIRVAAKRFKVDTSWRRRRNAGVDAADSEEVAAMSALIVRMEDRIATLERILDAEDPKWRTKL